MSDNVQVATAVISLVGTVVSGVLTYMLARLKSDQDERNAVATARVDEIQQALARIEANRSNMHAIKRALEQHGVAMIDNVRSTAARLAADASPEAVRQVLDQHGRAIMTFTQDTLGRLARIDAADRPAD